MAQLKKLGYEIGSHSFFEFKEYIQTESRYYLNGAQKYFLDKLLETIVPCEISTNTRLWRAQIAHQTVNDCNTSGKVLNDTSIKNPLIYYKNYLTKQYLPAPPNRMKPDPNIQQQGRCNPAGFQYLYLAFEENTAIAETRPWIESLVTVAEFKLNQSVKVVDCTAFLHEEDGSIDFDDGTPPIHYSLCPVNCVWNDINEAFARPVIQSDSATEYPVTQFLASAFATKGFDGIKFRSSIQKKGNNLVLFDISVADVHNAAKLKKITKINYCSESA